MGYEVLRTEAFEWDFEQAVRYLLDVLHARDAACHLVDELDKAVGLLESVPYMNTPSKRLPLKTREYREHLVMNYVAVYRIEGSVVMLMRFFHQTQLIELHF